MKIITVQSDRGADAAAQIISVLLVLVGCSLETNRRYLIITYDGLSRCATLESNESTLLSFFKEHGMQQLRKKIVRFYHSKEVSGHMIHPLAGVNIPNHQEYVNVCHTHRRQLGIIPIANLR
jgi:hypothetical protein